MNQKVTKETWYLIYKNTKVKIVIRWQRSMSELTELQFHDFASQLEVIMNMICPNVCCTLWHFQTGLPYKVTPAQFAYRLPSYTNTFKTELCFRGQCTGKKSVLLYVKHGSGESFCSFFLSLEDFSRIVYKSLCFSTEFSVAGSSLWNLYLLGCNTYWC